MHPQEPHFPQQNERAPDETPTVAPSASSTSSPAFDLPPLPPLPDTHTLDADNYGVPTVTSPRPPTGAPSQSTRLTRPPMRRAARPTMPIRPPTLPGLEDEVRSADAEVRSMALAPIAAHRTLAPASGDHESAALLIRGAARPPRPAARVVPRRNGPRSFLMQFLVAMVATVILASTLAFTTPLGQSMAAATSGQFATSAGGFLFAPTPTATPKPKPSSTGPVKGANPGQQVIINEINAVFGQYAAGALNIARCESGYDPNAVNSYPIGNSHASGVFQILYPSTWNTTSYRAYSPFDYDKNIHAAYEIFHRDGNSWREWACKP